MYNLVLYEIEKWIKVCAMLLVHNENFLYFPSEYSRFVWITLGFTIINVLLQFAWLFTMVLYMSLLFCLAWIFHAHSLDYIICSCYAITHFIHVFLHKHEVWLAPVFSPHAHILKQVLKKIRHLLTLTSMTRLNFNSIM